MQASLTRRRQAPIRERRTAVRHTNGATPSAELETRVNRRAPVQRIAQMKETLARRSLRSSSGHAATVQRQPWLKTLLQLSKTRISKSIVDLARKSPVRHDYEKQVRDLKERTSIYMAQSLSAMDIGADPFAETEPVVLARQGLKDLARKSTPPWMMDFIKQRQEKKYGGGGEIQDPTTGSLLSKNLFKGLSPEHAAIETMGSATRPAPDLFREVEPWLAKQDHSYLERILSSFPETDVRQEFGESKKE